MRILFVSGSGNIGGAERSLLALLDQLHQMKFSLTVICPTEGHMIEACGARGIPCYVLNYDWVSWSNPTKFLINYFRWCRLIKEVRPQIVHVNDLPPVRAVALPAQTYGIPIVCHVRFPMPQEFTSWCLRRLPKPKVFLFVSYALQDELKRQFQEAFPQSRCQAIHNGMHLDTFRYSERPIQEPLRIAIIAHLYPVKGHPLFLEMAHKLVRKFPGLEFWIVGTDLLKTGYQKELETMVEKLDLGEYVKFLGFQQDIVQLLGQINILVSTSLVEPLGRSIIEAMSTGLPVVGTNVGGTSEIIQDGKTGFLVPSGDVDALVQAVAQLIRDPNLRLVMGKAARQRVEDCFSIEKHTTAVLDVYCSLLSNRSAPSD